MGLRERATQIGKATHNYLERRGKANEHLKSLKFIQDVDTAIGLPQQMADVMHELNAHRTPHSPAWKLYRMSPATIYTGQRVVNGLPEGGEGYVLLRRISRKRVSPITKEDRYAYIFVGRTFKSARVGISLVPQIDDKTAERIIVRAGETAQFANSLHTVGSKKEMVRLIIDNSVNLLDYYGDMLTSSQITIGNVQEIRQNLYNNAWKTTARDSFKARLYELIFGKEDKEKGKKDGIEEYNKKHGKRSLFK